MYDTVEESERVRGEYHKMDAILSGLIKVQVEG